jgi:hypothetical protein
MIGIFKKGGGCDNGLNCKKCQDLDTFPRSFKNLDRTLKGILLAIAVDSHSILDVQKYCIKGCFSYFLPSRQ